MKKLFNLLFTPKPKPFNYTDKIYYIEVNGVRVQYQFKEWTYGNVILGLVNKNLKQPGEIIYSTQKLDKLIANHSITFFTKTK